MEKEALLAVDHLKTYFYIPEGVVKAVNDVSFSIKKGESLGILGESGCGKSVTAMSILRLLPEPPGKIVGGSICFEGKNLLELSKKEMRAVRGNDIAMIFQEPMTALNPVYTLGDQISEAFIIHQGLHKKDALEKSIEQLALVGIPSPEKRVSQYPHEFSGGMRQRAMIALALACHPKLLIADEPTTALDVTIQAQILDLILQLQEMFHMSLMIISHNIGVISTVCDKVIVMYAGMIVEHCSLEVLLKDARHPYTLGLMSSIPIMGEKFTSGKKRLNEIQGIVPELINIPRNSCLFAPRCPLARDRCRKEEPPEFTLGHGHSVKCWEAASSAI